MHPAVAAQKIARLLDSDPVAARQVQEYLTPERLIELLEIPAPTFDEAAREAMLEWVVCNVPRKEVIAAYSERRKEKSAA